MWGPDALVCAVPVQEGMKALLICVVTLVAVAAYIVIVQCLRGF